MALRTPARIRDFLSLVCPGVQSLLLEPTPGTRRSLHRIRMIALDCFFFYSAVRLGQMHHAALDTGG